MKIKSIIKIFITILLILFVAWFFTSGNVYAASAAAFIPGDDVGITPGDPTYTEPIPEQDYEGISINSHIANDFEFLGLDAPATYATGNEKKVITIAEALYKDENGKVQNEIVVYFYHPSYKSYALPNQQLQISFRVLEQSKLINNEYVKENWLPTTSLIERTDYLYEVSHYNGIKKYTFGSKLNNYLLNDSTSQTVGKKTIIDVDLSKTGYLVDYPYNGRQDVYPTKLFNQEFQFISEIGKEYDDLTGLVKNKRSSDNSVKHVSSCVSYDKNTVSVSGKALRFRYNKEQVKKLKFAGVGSDCEYTDFFFLFFNVEDDLTGTTWDNSKHITQVNLNYYVANVSLSFSKQQTINGLLSRELTTAKVNYIDSNGETYITDSFDTADFQYRDVSKLKLINQIITSETITHKYPNDCTANEITSWFGHQYFYNQVEFKTLFSTDDASFTDGISADTNFDKNLLNQYNFGLVYGNANGYAASSDISLSAYGIPLANILPGLSIPIFTNVSASEFYSHVVIDNIIDIEYEEDGQRYIAVVSQTNIDSSEIDKPIDGGTVMPGEPIGPLDENGNTPWWQKIYDFFVNIINKIKAFFSKIGTFFSSAKSVIIVSVIVVIAIALIITLFKVINFINTARVARGLKKYNKKE